MCKFLPVELFGNVKLNAVAAPLVAPPNTDGAPVVAGLPNRPPDGAEGAVMAVVSGIVELTASSAGVVTVFPK